MESKKVFVGSLYEFGSEARTTTIEEYREALPLGAARPFISYDDRRHLFSFTCNRTDTAAVSDFFSSVYAYVDVFEKKKLEDFIQSSPKLKAMKGTAIKDAFILDDNEESGEDLLDVGEDSDSNVDGVAPGHNNPYWIPLVGNSQILTRDIAKGITDATEASLYPEHDRNRVVILGGNAHEALARLIQLEQLMDFLTQQRKDGSSRPSTNVLMLPTLGDLSTLHFKLVANCPLAIERIVVDQRFHKVLDKKCMTQILNRDGRHGAWLIPVNMTEDVVRESFTSSQGYSLACTEQSYPTFGNSTSAKPVAAIFSSTVPIVLPTQKFVTASKAHDIDKWTENIAEGIDPEAIAVEAPIETVASEERQRKVRVDSNDEEEKVEAAPPPVRQRKAMLDSDDEVEEIIVSEPVVQCTVEEAASDEADAELRQPAIPPSRARKVALDSDDEGDDVDEKATSPTTAPTQPRLQPQLQPQPTWMSNPFAALVPQEDHLDTYESVSVPGQGAEPVLFSGPASNSPHFSLKIADVHLLIEAVPEDIVPSEEIPTSSPQFPNRHEFEPNRHGRVRHGGYTSRGAAPAPCGMGLPSRTRGPSPRATFRGVSNPSTRGAPSFCGRGAASLHDQTSYHHPDLLQLSTIATSSENIQPPPGLNIRVNTAQLMLPSTQFNLLDDPLDNIQLPSIKPLQVGPEHSQEPQSASNKKSSNVSSGNSGASYVNTYNPPRDYAKMENDQLAMLKKMQKEEKEKKRLEKEAEKRKNENQHSPKQTLSVISSRGTQQRQKDDETTSRCFHSTMGQQAPKPGTKGKQAAKKMTEKDKKQKLNELLGDPVTSILPSKPTPPNDADVEKMSTRKKQALKRNPELDPAAAAQLAEKQLSSRQTVKLIEYLNPLFEASRAFRGDVKFEIQLGQVLIANSKDLVTEDVQFISTKKWESFFSPPARKQQAAATTFTKILTRNGHDVDRLLKIKPPRGSNEHGPAKLFDELKPGLSDILYEFHCQSKENEEFWIVVDQTGKYHVRKSTSTIGTVNLHYPANIWDARAVLYGTADFCKPDKEIAMIVASFMETVYVPAQKTISITYRQPSENDMTVRSVIVKRTSLHDCHIMDRQDFQLQVTEVKSLFHRFHQKDKKLSQSFEKDYQDMLNDDRIHYELSLIDKSISEVLRQNRTLEIGFLTNSITTGKTLLKPQIIQNMLDLISHIVSKIDWAGVRNNGTLLKNIQEQRDLEARVANTLPPGTQPSASFTGLASTAGGRAVRSQIPGVRMNTVAEIGYDADKNPVLIGQGGAMIPLPAIGEDESNIPASELVPNDSASNIGIDRRPAPYVSSAAYARGLVVRDPNFW